MMEPIQGEAGVVVPDPGYLKVKLELLINNKKKRHENDGITNLFLCRV